MIQTARWRFGLFSFALVVISIQTSLSQVDQLQTEIGKILKYESPVDFQIVPGILVGVHVKDTSYICSFGASMSPDSLYELGAVTQPVTAWLALKALDSLGMSFSDPVCRLLPDSFCNNGWQTVTFGHLVNHLAGFPRQPRSLGSTGASITDPYESYHFAELAQDIMLTRPDTGRFSFSYFGYGVLHWLFERVGGLDAFTARMMHNSLHMDNTQWVVPDAQIAMGYGLDGRPQLPWHCSVLAPAAGLKSTMHDLLIWMEQLLLESKSLATVNTSKKKAGSSVKNPLSADAGWFLLKRGSSQYYFHAGRTGRHYVSIAWIPGTDLASIVISNGASGSGDLSIRVLDMISQAR